MSGGGEAAGAATRRVRVKLCGTARAEDLALACELGVDYVGFVFAESPRRVSPEQVGAWRRDLPACGSPPLAVGVFVNAPLDELANAARLARLDKLQLHGDESPDYCDAARRIAPLIRVVRLHDTASIDALEKLPADDMILIEPHHPGLRGGTGTSLAVPLARAVAERRAVFLAGGLRPETVADAVREVRPFAVDVASGIESAPGRRDPALAARFVREARAVALATFAAGGSDR